MSSSDRIRDVSVAGEHDPPGWAPAAPTITLLTAVGILMVGQMYTIIPLFGPISESFGTGTDDVTWLVTSFGVAYACGFLLAGPLSDGIGPRNVIVGGLVLGTVATSLVAFAPNLLTACALRALQGVTIASFAPSAYAYVGGNIAPERRSLGLACISSGFLAAGVLMQVVAQLIADALNWQAVFLVCGPAMLATAVVARFALRSPSVQGSVSSRITAAFRVMPRLATSPRLVALYVTTTTLLGGFVAMYTAIDLAGPPSVRGDADALLILRSSALPAVALIPAVATYLSRKIPAVQTRIVLGFGISAVAAASTAYAQNDLVVLAVVLMFFVFGIGLASPVIVEAVGSLAPTESRGSAVALYAFAMFTGASLGAPLATLSSASAFTALVLGVAGTLGAGAVLAATTVRPQSRHRDTR